MRYGAIVFVRGKMGLRHGGGVPYRRRQRRLCGDHRHDRDRRRRAAHLFANQNGHILMTKSKVTLTGTPAFSNAFAVAQYTGLVSAYSNRYSDAATGVRYRASGNSVIFVSGGANTVFPGDAAGVVTGGGQYL
jgi:hypothetical protein